MNRLESATVTLQLFAALLAILAARRRPEHRPVAIFLVVVTFANAVRTGIDFVMLGPARQAMRIDGLLPALTPFTGATRAAFHLEQALFLLWPTGLAAVALAVFLRRRPVPVLLPWTLAVVALVIGYPTVRGDLLRRAYLAAELAALMVGLGCFLMWTRHRDPLTRTHTSTMFLVGIDCATLLGPYRFDPFTSWKLGQAMYLVLYAVLIVLQGSVAWGPSPPSKSD